MDNTIDIMDKGVACLIEKLGIINTERFIAQIKRENFDYTLWRREYFDNMSLDDINNEAVSYAKKYPHQEHGYSV